MGEDVCNLARTSLCEATRRIREGIKVVAPGIKKGVTVVLYDVWMLYHIIVIRTSITEM